MERLISQKVFEAMVFVHDLADREPTNEIVWFQFYDMEFAGHQRLLEAEFLSYRDALIKAGFVIASAPKDPFFNGMLYEPSEKGLARLEQVKGRMV